MSDKIKGWELWTPETLISDNADLRAENKRLNESCVAMLKVITEDLPRIQADRDMFEVDLDRIRTEMHRIHESRTGLRDELARLKSAQQAVNEAFSAGDGRVIDALRTENQRLRTALEEVATYGHWSDCPAGASNKYRCRCGYGDVREVLDYKENQAK